MRRWFCEGSESVRVHRRKRRMRGGGGKGRGVGMAQVRSEGSLPEMVWFRATTL